MLETKAESEQMLSSVFLKDTQILHEFEGETGSFPDKKPTLYIIEGTGELVDIS